MHSLASRPEPIPTLYVKSLGGCNNAFFAIRQIFLKARQCAPCLLVLEDLDSLISDSVKSFFLNEVDGLEENDGLMIIGSTNHLERLDAGISKRPGRFDRKYHFALPAHPERTEYCNVWRSKLVTNKNIDFPENLSSAIADLTEGFSFAYLKEMFVTALLVIVAAQRNPPSSNNNNHDLERGSGLPDSDEPNGVATARSAFENVLLWRVIRKQVQTLRAEVEGARKSAEEASRNSNSAPTSASEGALDDTPYSQQTRALY